MKTTLSLCTMIISASLALAADGDKSKKPAEGAKPDPSNGPRPEEVFKKLDTNADGWISKEEFNAGPMAKQNPERAAKAFTFKDADKDGKLTKEEFAKRPEGQPDQNGKKPNSK